VIDIDCTAIGNPHAVIWRYPVSGINKTIDGVNLRKGHAVALQHLLAGIATITIGIQPMGK
jgi:hypothetical protein